MHDWLNLSFQQAVQSASGGHYENLQRLGVGGSAETYLTLATSGSYRGHLFALKIFRRLSKPEWRESFLKEIEFLQSCSHPAIMRVFDRGLYRDEHPFVVAEFLPQTLSDVIRSRISVVEKLRYSLHLLSAIDYLAGQTPPVVHRDIKPGNIFIKGGSCVLGDFGLMKLQIQDPDVDRQILKESLGPGMPRSYRTPDLVAYLNGGDPPTTKSDVFQLGLVLAEFFTGRNPLKPLDYQGGVESEIELQPLNFIPGDFGIPVKDLIQQMLVTDPVQRPSAHQVFNDWQGVFLSAARRVNALEGRVFE